MLDLLKIKEIAGFLHMSEELAKRAFESLLAYERHQTKFWSDAQKAEADLAIQALQNAENQYGVVKFPIKKDQDINPVMQYLDLPHLSDGLCVYSFATEASGSGWFHFFPRAQGYVVAINEGDARSYGQKCLESHGISANPKEYFLKVEKADVLMVLAKKDRLLEKNLEKANKIIAKTSEKSLELKLALESLHICDADMRRFLRDAPRTHWASIKEASMSLEARVKPDEPSQAGWP